jgi:hypothetical protein
MIRARNRVQRSWLVRAPRWTFVLAACALVGCTELPRRWQEDRPYFTLNRTPCGAWLEGSWGRQPANSALKLHWSRRAGALQMQTVFARRHKKPSRGDPV